jgi:hypothetical protein
MEDYNNQDRIIADFLDTAEKLPPEIAASMWLSLGCILSASNRTPMAELIASTILASEFGSAEERQHFMPFSLVLIQAMDIIDKASTPTSWTNSQPDGKLEFGAYHASNRQEDN